jgi:deoxyadenosine/deoxycytidine kinase
MELPDREAVRLLCESKLHNNSQSIDMTQRPMIISIEGNIGVGKSTLIDNLEAYHKNENIQNVIILREPVDAWNLFVDSKDNQNILAKFYNDPQKFSFSFQIVVLKTILELLTETIEKNPDCELIICERSILSSRHVFTKMLYDSSLMNELEYKIYESLFDEWVNSNIFTPSKIVFLNITPEVSFERINKRNRIEENVIELDYIKSCGLYHQKWIDSLSVNVEILNINCDSDVTYNLDDENNLGRQWVKSIVEFSNNGL